MREGQFYLVSAPFFWTVVGRYVRHLNFMKVVLADAMYFTRTGATFDVLCAEGLVLTGDRDRRSLYHPMRKPLLLPDGTEVRNGILVPANGLEFPWGAPTPWVKQ